MQMFFLRGLAEGLAGRSTVMAENLEEVFNRIPSLLDVREKLVVENNTISGYCACDG